MGDILLNFDKKYDIIYKEEMFIDYSEGSSDNDVVETFNAKPSSYCYKWRSLWKHEI